MAGNPPSGTVTFLLTDLEGSTRMWEQEPKAMKAAMVRHDEILEKTIAAHQGYVFARMGDGMAASFATAGDAVASAIAIKQGLAEENWRTPAPLKARIGLHTAEAVIVDDSGYANLPINRCSRLMSAAHGGQIVVSGATEALVRGAVPAAVELRDLGEHRLRDLGHAMRVFELSPAGRSESFPPLESLDSFPGNLPAQVTSFIGRNADGAAVIAALGESRVVTITGVGGVGKTRLALQVAADVVPRYSDGAWLVELAPLRDPDGVVSAVAVAFRLSSIGSSLEDTLVEMLTHKDLLLVLDNCEHVLPSVARLVSRIERECPGVVVLATSREGMAVGGEQLIALAPLASGEPKESIDHLVHTDAVSLFVERARHVKADFAVTANNASAVVEICQRLDGVPLAIELAAARVIALSPSELVQRLDRRFQLLAGGLRGGVERHATLRAAIDWSYELLDEAEQRLLARMAVFSGGCTLEAVEEVCSGDPIERDAVVDIVTGLVARSLVVAEDRGLGTRYRLLETIRQYGEERLAAWGETEPILTAHSHFYAALLARAAERSYGPEQLSWAGRMDLERDNVRMALNTAIERNDGSLAVELVANHPNRHGQFGATPVGAVLGGQIDRVLDLAHASESPQYPRALMVGAYQTFWNGECDYATSRELCSKALTADQESDASSQGPRIEMDARNLQALASFSAGAYADAVHAYSQAAELARADGYPGVAATYLAFGVNARVLGGIGAQQAIPEAEDSIALARQSGMPRRLCRASPCWRWPLRITTRRGHELFWTRASNFAASLGTSSSNFVTGSMVAGRLRDWQMTLNLTSRAMQVWRWDESPLWAAILFAECARAVAEEDLELAGILRGAAYAAFHQASPVRR